MDPTWSKTSCALGDLLRAAREWAGLSRSGLAQLLGRSWETVRQAEEGRVDPQVGTLARYLEVLPFLSPGGLLGGDPTAPPLAADSPWRFHRELFGFVAKRVVLDVRLLADGRRSETLEVSGVRALRGHLSDPAVRTNLMQAVLRAPPPLLKSLQAEPADLAGEARVFGDDQVRHVFTFPRSLARDGFRYRRECADMAGESDAALMGRADESVRSAETVALDVEYPVEMLELRITLPPGRAACVAPFLAPNSACPPAGAIALAGRVHPGGHEARWDPGRRRLVVRIPRPPPEMRHGVAIIREAESIPSGFELLPAKGRPRSFALGAVAGGDTLGGRVAAAREAAGLSRRALAARMDVSPATVIQLERGRDPRVSTLTRVLDHLDGLDAAACFPGLGTTRALDADGVWLYYRALWGMEADEASRELVLTPDGDAREEIGTTRLRRVGRESELVVRDGISHAIQGTVGPVFVEQDEDGADSDLRIQWRRLPREQPEFLLTVPAELSVRGASFVRREEKTATYKMRSDQGKRSIGPAYQCYVPLRRLTLSVQFPIGYWPLDLQASVRAATNITNPRWPDLKDEIHPNGLELELSPERGLARLRVERPLLGFRYSVRWRAP